MPTPARRAMSSSGASAPRSANAAVAARDQPGVVLPRVGAQLLGGPRRYLVRCPGHRFEVNGIRVRACAVGAATPG